MTRLLLTVLLACALSAWACGPSLPRPRMGPHAPGDYSSVDQPPPSPRAQVIPAAPSVGAVWVDGEWVPLDGSWSWQPGGWVTPPPGAWLALSEVRWQNDGTLRYAPGLFRLPDGSSVMIASLLGLDRDTPRSCPAAAEPSLPSLEAFVPAVVRSAGAVASTPAPTPSARASSAGLASALPSASCP